MPDQNGTLLPTDPGYVQPGAGLVNSAPGNTNVSPATALPGPDKPIPSVASYTPAQATADVATSKGYNPNAFAVTDDQTVQGQLSKIMSADSPLLQQAKARANIESNNSGLLDSSMAQGAAEQALLSSALPIAQQDASTYNKEMENTQNAKNAAAAFEAQAGNTAELQTSQQETAVAQGNQKAINDAFQTAVNNITQLTNTQLNNETQLALKNLDIGLQVQLTNLQNANKNLLQTNSSASSMFSQVLQNVGAIQQNDKMGQDAKNTAINDQINFLNQGLQQLAGVASTSSDAVGSLNLSKYFQEAGAGGAIPQAGAFQPSTSPAAIAANPPPPPTPPQWVNTPEGQATYDPTTGLYVVSTTEANNGWTSQSYYDQNGNLVRNTGWH